MESTEFMRCFYNDGELCKNLVRGSGDEGRTITACRQEYEGNPESAAIIESGKGCGSDLRVQNMLPTRVTNEAEVQNA